MKKTHHTLKSSSRGTALVTGASRGLGRGFAELLARDGYDLVVVARDRKTLNALAAEWKKTYGIRVKVFVKDLSILNAAEDIAQALEGEMMHVDILVNNAGFGLHGRFDQMPAADQLAMVQVNIATLTHLTRLLLPEMLNRKSGKILNVASTAGYFAGPSMAVYNATKAYVVSLSEALAQELKGTGVTVTLLCPGPTRTGFQARAGTGAARVNRSRLVMEAEEVVRAGYDAMIRGKRRCIPGVLNRIAVQSERILPRSAAAAIVQRLRQP